ncbi:MAG: electron transfer flavoprotein beta subunit/FixA family protein [Actinomycetaceae bacterium]|nr:electron transfer flavoprotein beta subunit/FixA family protein [Actinomycetaceae bacterium]
MSIVVAYKYTSNPQDARVGADGVVDWSRAKPLMSEYDPVAVQVGRAVADATGEELVGITVGMAAIGKGMATKNAMSRGFDRGVIIADDATADWNPTRYASALAQIVTSMDGVKLVITGDSSIDNGTRMTSAILGGYLGWPVFQEVEKITATDSGFELLQQVDGGTRTVVVDGPVVVAATSDAMRVPVPSMKEILAAGKKPVDVRALDTVTVSDTDLRVTGRAKPVARERKQQIFTGDSAVADLVAALRNDGVL